jgi:hypothetical protein
VSGYAMRLSRDVFRPGHDAPLVLPALNRALFVLAGAADVEQDDGLVSVLAGQAWYSDRSYTIRPGTPGTIVLRCELFRGPAPVDERSTMLIEHAIELDPTAEYLLRCDRVEFEPGDVALPHGHHGGGIRYLVTGSLEITIGNHPARLMTPDSAWFESGREPVLAVASLAEPTAFIRVAILPREIRGQSSIWYADPADAKRSRAQRTTLYLDEPIELA